MKTIYGKHLKDNLFLVSRSKWEKEIDDLKKKEGKAKLKISLPRTCEDLLRQLQSEELRGVPRWRQGYKCNRGLLYGIFSKQRTPDEARLRTCYLWFNVLTEETLSNMQHLIKNALSFKEDLN